MQQTIDAFWRAAAYCLHPRVVWLSLLPLIVAVSVGFGLAYFFWEPALAAVRQALDHWSLSQWALDWLDMMGASGFRAVVAPLIVVALSIPMLVLLSLWLVAALMMPALVRLVVNRRFDDLAVRGRAPWWSSLGWTLVATAWALLVLIVSLPLWLIPPLAFFLPPLIWGWLTYRVMSFDALAEHASPQEREVLLREHRAPLLTMGVVSGYLGAAPSALWALSAMTLMLAPFLVVITVWLYTLVFAFSSLWFAHYLLSALRDLRARVEPLTLLTDTDPA
ncbi:MAG: EI24 domain-containing protein [Pseudomonadota bacterium]